jgi:hypothetical protein
MSPILNALLKRPVHDHGIQGIFVGAWLAWLTFQLAAMIMTTRVNGWTALSGGGAPGGGRLRQAVDYLVFPGPVNVPQEAMYWRTKVDGAGGRLNGRQNYVLRFPPGGLPPNNAFWSLTMGDAKNRFVPNPINRYSVSGRSGLVPNADGSVEVYIQSAAPAGRESNWLPAPAGPFILWLRVYQPGAAILDGKYRVPPVVRAQGPGKAGRPGAKIPDVISQHLTMWATTAIVAWAVYRRFFLGGRDLIPFALFTLAAWGLGTFAVVRFWPGIVLNVYKKAILVKGFGDGPVPINSLYTEPEALFADPLHPPASGSNLATTGVNRDTLLVAGWLDLSGGPQVLHVPDMAGRYYSVQFTDPSDGIHFAYIGKRTTGTQAGDYLIRGPGWIGAAPPGMALVSSPSRSVLVIGRVFVANDGDLPTAYDLAKRIRTTSLRRWRAEIESDGPGLGGRPENE